MQWQIRVFQNPRIYLEAHVSSLVAHTVSCFLEVTSSFNHFQEIPTKHQSLNTNRSSQSFSSKHFPAMKTRGALRQPPSHRCVQHSREPRPGSPSTHACLLLDGKRQHSVEGTPRVRAPIRSLSLEEEGCVRVKQQ